METKNLYKSKTIILAIAQALVSLFAVLSTTPEFATIGWLGIAKSMLDVYIRFQTKTEIK